MRYLLHGSVAFKLSLTAAALETEQGHSKAGFCF